MPELPEVETTRRGIAPHLEGDTLVSIEVRQPRLRWPVPPDLSPRLAGRRLQSVARRAKYLLLQWEGGGTLLIHLGMSGSLRIVAADTPAEPHDHIDWRFGNGHCLRLRDPRRFGAVLWCDGDPHAHPLLRDLGPEPLADAFDGDHLHRLAQGRRMAVKPFLMDNRIVVGVGNIYATEALFRAGIDPARAAGRISLARYRRLAEAVRAVLSEAIAAGGTTLRDFVSGEGRPGYFRQSLQVYGRTGQPCPVCATPLRAKRLGQRTSTWCPHCQH